jgi:thiamine-phosphate pyrophosphorylase
VAGLPERDLYLVTCEELSDGRSDLEVVRAALDGGLRLLQLRDKRSCARDLFYKAEALRRLTADAGATLIMNDRLDVALAVGADGVHLGQGDLPVAHARRVAPGLIIGASTHSLEQALAAQAAGASYVNIGPLFATGTKPDAPQWLGVDAIGAIAPRLSIPFTVMGGINLANLGQVLATGARLVAVVTAVTRAPDVRRAVEGLRARILAGS